MGVSNFRGGITTKYPLAMIVRPAQEFSLQFTYDTQRFSKPAIHKLLQCMQVVLTRIVAHPEHALLELQKFLAKKEDMDSNKLPRLHDIFDRDKQQGIKPTGGTKPAGWIKLADSQMDNREKEELKDLSSSRGSATKTNDFLAPREGLEQELAKIWQKVLGVDSISVTANFFQLGGNSLLVVNLLEQVESELGKKVPMVMLFQAPTIQQFAQVIGEHHLSTLTSSVVPVQAQGSKPPLFFYGVKPSHSLAPYLGADQPIYGLVPQDLKGRNTSKSIFKEMASQYVTEILTQFPDGPYVLGGHCWAGMLTYEMAQQLQQQGKTVKLLVLLATTFKIPNKIYLSYIMRRRIFEHVRNLFQLGAKEKLSYIRDDLARGVRDKILSVTRRVRKLKNKTTKTYATTQLARFDATGDYEPLPYSGSVVVFYGEENPVKHNDDPRYLTWRSYVKGDLEIHNTAGKYGAILTEPHISTLAKQIKSCLD